MLNIPSLIYKFCDTVWEYDLDTNSVYLHYDSMTPQLCGKWIPYDQMNCMYQEKYVYPLDMQIWERFLTPEGLKRFIDENMEEEHFYIRFEHTQKGTEWHEVYFQRVEGRRLLLASRDVKDMQRNAAIAQAIVPEFDYVCCIDVKTQGYVLYYSDADSISIPQSASDSYNKILEEFNRVNVVPEEVEQLTEQMRLERVIKELEDKDEYILYCTALEHNCRVYKKLRYSYESPAKDRLLLTRINIGDLVGERILREKERERRLQYLQNMPVAFCSTHVLVDENGNPYDFQFTYCNRAHEELEGVKEGELLGKRFYQFFKDGDPKWLNYYYETAYKGISHVVRSYSPEIQKHLLIYTFPVELGHCECVLMDVSEQYFLTQELERSREDMKRILETTTELVFQYRPESGEVILDNDGKGAMDRVLTKASLHGKLLRDGLLDEESCRILEKGFVQIKSGEHSVIMAIRGRFSPNERWNWYRVTMFDFQDGYTHERKVLGFLQNIDQDMCREEELRKKAQTDSLTGVLNAGTGKQEILKKLERTSVERTSETEGCYNAMFVMDMDNFKDINDMKGHLTGDKTLIKFAETLRKTFRTEDVIYRLGGDEFVVFVDKIHTPDQSVAVMLHRFRMNMEKAKAEYPFLSCSIGVFVTNRQHSFEEYYESADQALYETKKQGKGYYTIKKED